MSHDSAPLDAEAVLLAELGPNPAALAEALWALPRIHATRVTEAFVLTSGAGCAWFEREILASTVYAQLVACLGDAVPPLEGLHVRVVTLDDELSPEDADAWNEARWANATAALRAAGDRPVVFALAGGRQRGAAALTTVMFQLLARPQDRLVDVRVGDRRVEGARAGFFFPEQARQLLCVDGESFLAKDVPVHLVEIRVPRLRRLLAERELDTWTDALAAGQRAIEEVPRIELVLDLAKLHASVNDSTIKLQETEFVWLATVVRALLADGVGWVWSGDTDALVATMRTIQVHRPEWTPNAASLSSLLKPNNKLVDGGAAMRKLRSTTAVRWTEALEAQGFPRATLERCSLEVESLVHPETGKRASRWRLPIAPERVRLR